MGCDGQCYDFWDGDRQRLADVCKRDHVRIEPRSDELRVSGSVAEQIRFKVLEKPRRAREVI